MPDYVGIIITAFVFLFLPQAIFCMRERKRLCPEQSTWLWKDWVPFYNMLNLHYETGSSLAYIYGCIILIIGTIIPFVLDVSYLAAFIIWAVTILLFEMACALFIIPYIKTVSSAISDRTFFSVVSSMGLLYYAVFLNHRRGDHYNDGALKVEDIMILTKDMFEANRDKITPMADVASRYYKRNEKPKEWADNKAITWLPGQTSSKGRIPVVAEPDKDNIRMADLGPSAYCLIRPVLILTKPVPKAGAIKRKKFRKTYPEPGDEFVYKTLDYIMLDETHALAKTEAVICQFSKTGVTSYEGSDAEETAVRWALAYKLIPTDLYVLPEDQPRSEKPGDVEEIEERKETDDNADKDQEC